MNKIKIAQISCAIFFLLSKTVPQKLMGRLSEQV